MDIDKMEIDKMDIDPVPSEKPIKCKLLFIANLHEAVSYDEIEEVCSKFGRLFSIKLCSEPPYYSYVYFEEFSSAERAKEELHGSQGLLSSEPLIVWDALTTDENMVEQSSLLSKLNAFQLAKQKDPLETDAIFIPKAAKKPHIPVPVMPQPPSRSQTGEERYYCSSTGCWSTTKGYKWHCPQTRDIENQPNTSVEHNQ